MMYGFENFGQGFSMGWGTGLPSLFAGGFIIFLLWSLFWKGLALWHSAQKKQPWWFVILLVVNTLGILEIIYLFAVAKLKFSELFSKSTPMRSAQMPPSGGNTM
jgi:hypothetical protein